MVRCLPDGCIGHRYRVSWGARRRRDLEPTSRTPNVPLMPLAVRGWQVLSYDLFHVAKRPLTKRVPLLFHAMAQRAWATRHDQPADFVECAALVLPLMTQVTGRCENA